MRKIIINTALLMLAATPALAAVVTGTPADVVIFAVVLIGMILNSLGSGPR